MSQFDSIRFQPSRPLLKEVSADRLNAILSEIKKNRPRGERGITVRQAGDATYIGLASNAKGGVAPTTQQPWDLTATQDPNNENQYLVRVSPGTLNGILPSNWDQEFTCADTGLYYAKAVIATDGTSVSGVSIEINTTAPTIQTAQSFALQTNIQYLCGLFFEGGVYRVISDGHIALNAAVWMTKEKATAAQPGELPWEQFYQLQS